MAVRRPGKTKHQSTYTERHMIKIDKQNKVLSFGLLGLFVAVGLLLLGIFMKNGIDDFAHRDRIVTVRGLSEREIQANQVTWPIVIKLVGNDLPTIYNQIQSNNAVILNYLKKNGITDQEISVNAPQVIDMRANQYNTAPAPYNYNVTSVVVVTSGQVDKVRNLINRQAELLTQGIAILAGDYNYPTVYDYTELNQIKPAMIADATKNARAAARKFAEDSHSKLGKIKEASQGQFSIEDRDQYTPDIKTVRVVSTIKYYLKD